MLVRREAAPDVPAVDAVVAAAFARRDDPGRLPVESALLCALRTSAEWIPALSLVAEGDAGVVGHVLCTRAWVGDAPVLGLGPVAVAPGQQRRGVGSALMHAVLGAADALEEPLVALLGHTTYYPRFGFVPAASRDIEAPDPAWGEHFMVRTLAAYRPGLHGRFRYAPAFAAV
jgi:putative acetyltransferase